MILTVTWIGLLTNFLWYCNCSCYPPLINFFPSLWALLGPPIFYFEENEAFYTLFSIFPFFVSNIQVQFQGQIECSFCHFAIIARLLKFQPLCLLNVMIFSNPPIYLALESSGAWGHDALQKSEICDWGKSLSTLPIC